MKDVLDLHTHTTASGHAYNTLYEMIHSAKEHGLELYGCSDHGPKIPGGPHFFYFINFKVIPRTHDALHVLMGAELNIMDFQGTVDLKEDTLNKLDYCIASLHTPCIQSGTMEENTAACVNAMKNPHVTILGHPDDMRYPLDYEALVKGAKETHTLIEVNSSSFHPLSSRKGAREAYQAILSICVRENVPIIMNSDAHCEADVGNHAAAIALLEELHFPEELVINTDVRKLIPYIPKLAEILS